MTGFIVVQAESHEEAARMFEGHPHFAHFPGDSVEVMECLPISGAVGRAEGFLSGAAGRRLSAARRLRASSLFFVFT